MLIQSPFAIINLVIWIIFHIYFRRFQMDFDYKNKDIYFDMGKKIAHYFDTFFRVMKATFGLLSIFLFVIFALAGGAGLGYFASLVENTPVLTQQEFGKNIYNYNQKSTLYYANEAIISDLRADLIRTPVTLDEISPFVLNAVIATEDENFYEHQGVVPKAIVRAAAQELTNAASISGGSTITQQLIKQQILTSEVTHSRKAVEMLYATDLENKFSKDDILQAYMNVSPFGRNSSGQNIAGIKEAAEGIFGVSPLDLTLPQAAFLAGLPKSPISYSPYTQYGELKENMEPGLYRQKDVLYRMFREGYLTKNDYDIARNYDITEDFLVESADEDKDPARSYVYDLVEREARQIIMERMLEVDAISAEELANNPELKEEYEQKADADIRNNGYKVYSTIDPDVHNAMEEKTKQTQDAFGATRTRNFENDNGETETIEYPVQVGGTLIENATGRVIAFVGGRDYGTKEFNNAFDSRRQTGSAIKPFMTYGPALEEKLITPATIVPDTELIVPDGSQTHSISNFGRTTNQWRDARHWLAVSQNIPNTKIYMEMLKQNIDVSKYIRALGMGPDAITDQEFYNASTSLGGYSGGPTPTELAGAYAAIGNKGVYNEPYVIERILDKNDDVIYEHEANPVTVWSEATNFMLYDILRDVSNFGTARSVNTYLNFNVDLASKTGTTNSFRDVWYAGVTPKISYVSWMGYDAPSNLNINLTHYGGLDPSTRNVRNWSNMLNTVYNVKPELIGLSERMSQPDDGSVVSSSVLVETGMKAGAVPIANGRTANISGATKSEIFARDNVPGTTSYNFAIGAKPQELQNFWGSYSSSRQATEEPVNKEETEETSDEEPVEEDESVEETPAEEPSEPEENTDESEDSDN